MLVCALILILFLSLLYCLFFSLYGYLVIKSFLLVVAELACHEKHSKLLHKQIHVIYSYFELPCALSSASSQTPASPSVAEALLAGKGGVIHSLQYYFLAHCSHYSPFLSHFLSFLTLLKPETPVVPFRIEFRKPFEYELSLKTEYGIEI